MIFLRHPRPAVAPGICYGRTDLDIGPGAADEIAAALVATPAVTGVISSPALRCRALAEALAGRDGVTLRLDPRLVEMDFGAWEGLAWDAIGRAESDPWADDPWTIAPPGGESFGALHARVSAALEEVAPATALVCHAGPIRAARMVLTGASFEAVFAEPVPHATPIQFAVEAA
ncbi:MAG: histidine phosphatase family protein [Paracoccaceae bacterium]|nr:histidine phosphatase family protein [Paracoccaceae bacterium]